MGVQCDVCVKEVSSTFCCADEAALCATCDVRVHTANILAAKHRRFSLEHPISDGHAPRCDVCQEKKALLFCLQDRAILCADCDASIHSVNEFTMNHSRFLLPGLKLSSTAIPTEEPSSYSGVADEDHFTPTEKKKKKNNNNKIKNMKKVNKKMKKVSCELTDLGSNGVRNDGNGGKVSGGDGTRDFCDYLMNTYPGWKVDDLLLDCTSAGADPCSSVLPAAPTAGADLCKMGFDEDKEEDLVFFPSMGHDQFHLESNGFNNFQVPAWLIPQVPQFPVQSSTANVNLQLSAGVEKQRWDWGGCDDFSAVPHIAHL